VPPDRKYENEGGPGVERIAALLREAMPARESGGAVRRFADALIWNWLIAGTDAHAKNYSLLLAGAHVRLAPLYDVASALPHPDRHVRWLRFAIKVGGDYRVELWQNPWPPASCGSTPRSLPRGMTTSRSERPTHSPTPLATRR